MNKSIVNKQQFIHQLRPTSINCYFKINIITRMPTYVKKYCNKVKIECNYNRSLFGEKD